MWDTVGMSNASVKLTKDAKKPTLRMIRAVELMVADGCKSAAGALREAGYSEAVARNPGKVTASKAFQDLLMQRLPTDEVLLQEHVSLLHASSLAHYDLPLMGETPADGDSAEQEAVELINSVPGWRAVGCARIKKPDGSEFVRAYYLKPEQHIRLKALDMVYKLRGLYTQPKAAGAAQRHHSLAELRRLREMKTV